jgi:hypothetical protein
MVKAYVDFCAGTLARGSMDERQLKSKGKSRMKIMVITVAVQYTYRPENLKIEPQSSV